VAWLLKRAQILGQPLVLPPLLSTDGTWPECRSTLSYAVARAVSLAVVPYSQYCPWLIVPTTMDHPLLLFSLALGNRSSDSGERRGIRQTIKRIFSS